ncbi:histidine kinase [Rhodococcus sp. CSLK01-03]|uniref:histidine kinase n=1 Tax=Rhodococcus indonesiensis TaxID=3055869 RepID=A0ABT7RNE0_9NOCA|nr:histidine kinase [Rhodococcus indonesiensis]MDM7488546.1 histidine kinase [Rhodococcus indonesiensis]
MRWTREHGRGRWGTIAIVAVTLILYAVAWPTLHLTHEVPVALMPVVAALAAWPFVAIRTDPALGWAVSAGAALAIPRAFDLVPGYDYPWQVVHILVLCALLVAVSMRASLQVAGLVWAATVVLFFTHVPGQDGWGWALGLTAMAVFGLLVRWLVLSRRQLARQEEVSELERARRAILEEKARIARDLHDIVAHHMSLVVVQAQSAPYRLPGVSEPVRAEFDSIGATAREALNEVRGMLGVLRSDSLPDDRGADDERVQDPQPGLDRLGDLFEGARRAGMVLSTAENGDPSGVSDATALTVYRILQESLANAARHASGAPVRVRVGYGPDEVSVTVCNGPRQAGPGPGDRSGGNGIRGMVDRALAVGGHLVAHPAPGGGFEVRAQLPRVPAA